MQVPGKNILFKFKLIVIIKKNSNNIGESTYKDESIKNTFQNWSPRILGKSFNLVAKSRTQKPVWLLLADSWSNGMFVGWAHSCLGFLIRNAGSRIQGPVYVRTPGILLDIHQMLTMITLVVVIIIITGILLCGHRARRIFSQSEIL